MAYFPGPYFAPRYFPPSYFPEDFGPPPPPSNAILVEASVVFKPVDKVLLVRAWLGNENGSTFPAALNPTRCRCYIIDEAGRVLFRASGSPDPAGFGEYIVFTFDAAQLSIQHNYLMEVTLESLNDPPGFQAWGQIPMPTVN